MTTVAVTDSIIADNYHKALNYLKAHGWFPYIVMGFWTMVFIVSVIVDYSISFDYFYHQKMNDFGEVPPELMKIIYAKACLGLSFIVLLKASFVMFHRNFQYLVFLCIFFVCVIVSINIGKAQIYPVIYDNAKAKYADADGSADAFSEWISETDKKPGKDENDNNDSTEFLEDQLGMISIVKASKWYAFAFPLFAFMGLVAVLQLSKVSKVVGTLNRARHYVSRYQLLERSEQVIGGTNSTEQCLVKNRQILYRAAQEEVRAAYSCGLRLIQKRLSDLIVYGEKNEAFSIYSFWQKYKPIRIHPMNIEETKEIIRKAEESLDNIKLIEINNDDEEKSQSKVTDRTDSEDFIPCDCFNAAIESVFEEE
ncbi:MAG: hypothetical protein HOC71_07285 [Candidatus Latescibacteria bacterium]|jgi:hypothetical protein|nr:hypothetical protein [Candidatus Latescibacterota bacterium]